MALAHFDEVPDFSFRWRVGIPAVRVKRDPTVGDTVVNLRDVERTGWTWTLRRRDAEVATIEAFFRARGWTRDSFLVRHPKRETVTGLALAAATASQSVFELPTPILANGVESGDYPKDDGPGFANTALTLDASPATITDVDTDARTITIATPASGGEAVVVAYVPLRRVRLAAEFEWRPLGVNYQEASLELEEVRA